MDRFIFPHDPIRKGRRFFTAIGGTEIKAIIDVRRVMIFEEKDYNATGRTVGIPVNHIHSMESIDRDREPTLYNEGARTRLTVEEHVSAKRNPSYKTILSYETVEEITKKIEKPYDL